MTHRPNVAVRLSLWLHRLATTPVTLFALVVFLVFTATALPAQSRLAEEASGSADSPDTSFFYTPSDLYRMAETYGPAGRAAYVRARWTFDIVWPLVYLFFLVTAISWLFRRGAPPNSAWQRANLAPVLGVLFDFLENASTSLVMLRYPARTPPVDALAPIFTALKWVFVGGSMALLPVGIVLVVVAVVRRRVHS